MGWGRGRERDKEGVKEGKDPWVESFGVLRLGLDWSTETTRILVTPKGTHNGCIRHSGAGK